ncbi:hypothetical protein Bca4012_020286 [Brassica carinata]
MITHLTCPKEAEKVTGEKRSYNYQSFNDESLAKLETQQAKFESCLAASLDIGAVRGSYLNNHKELINKLDCYGNLTHQGLTSNWNHVQSFSGERVMGEHAKMLRELGSIQEETTSVRKTKDSNHLIWTGITIKTSLALFSLKKHLQMQHTSQDRAETNLG